MLKPRRMSRIIIVGSKECQEKTIETLHGMNIIHIVDFVKPDGTFKLGTPLKKASTASEQLVKLRSIAKVLEVEETEIKRMGEEKVRENIAEKIGTIELNISGTGEAKTKMDNLLKELETKISELLPFSGFRIPLEAFRGYESLAVFVGNVGVDVEDSIRKITSDYELFRSEEDERLMALFAPKKCESEISKALIEAKYSEAKVPEGRGLAKDNLAELQEHRKKLEERLERTAKELETLRKKHIEFILACEEHLRIEVEKAEAPLRFATTEHSFIVDGWVASDKFDRMKKTLDKKTHSTLHIERLETREEPEEPPVALSNPKPARPFEFLLDMFSTPKYEEVDPTLILMIVFPIFFGLMIGDAGYGLFIMLFGVMLRKRYLLGVGGKAVGNILVLGGLFATIFGFALFGDFLGIPFQVHDAEYSWSSLLGVNIPIVAQIHKLEKSGVTDLLVLSIVAAFLHLSIGFIFGVVNEAKHNKKHSVAKIAWLLVLIAVFMLLIHTARGTRIGGWVYRNVLFASTDWAVSVPGLAIPMLTIILLIIGTVILVATEGIMSVMEIPSLVGNTISYTRLAAIGVAKGAMALAFNGMLLPMVLGGSVIAILGLVFLIGAHLMIFILGIISAGIQSLRLNYVEFFLKFYKGGGTKFTPFGHSRRHTIAG